MMDSEKEKKKRKRDDRSQKLKDRKDQNETVVKGCLLKALRDKRLVEAIEIRVKQFSERRKIASLALCHSIKELFQGVDDVTTVTIPEDIFDQTFIRQLFLGVEGVRKETLASSFIAQHPEYDSSFIGRSKGDSNIYSAGTIKHIANIKTSLRSNFSKRLLTFTKMYAPFASLNESERKGIFYQVCGWNIPSSFGAIFPNRKGIVDIVNEHRRILGLNGNVEISKTWMKCNDTLHSLLKYNVFLNREFVLLGGKTFNILPIACFGPSFITIDTLVLHGIAKELQVVSCDYSSFSKMKDEHWSSLFNISKYEGSKNKFTGTIETDGVSVCFHFVRPKTKNDAIQTTFESSNEVFKLPKNARVVGVDPGRSNIVCAAEILEDGSIRSYNLSRCEYYQKSGIFQAREKNNTWSKNIRDELEQLSEVSTKGCEVETHNKFMKVFLEVREVINDEYFKKRWRRQRLRLYGGKKRTMDNFYNKIKNDDPSRETIIAYGAAKFAPGGKNEISVPTERAFKEATKHFTVVPVDEFRTTKVYNVTDVILESVKSQKTGSTVRGLLWNRSPMGKFLDRDLNAALNIRRCITTPTRPASLTRSTPNLPSIPKKCGIVIKY